MIKLLILIVLALTNTSTNVTPVEEEMVQSCYIDSVNCPEDIQQIVYDVTQEYGISYTFMLALIERESDFQTDLVSSTNDYGLCQINECHFEDMAEYGLTNMFDVRQNVTACCIILQQYFEEYDDPNLVLMCYNFGPTGAKRCWNKGIYSSKYSRAIVQRADELERNL